jgi:mRNA interferase MazF
MAIKRGDIYDVDFSPGRGSEQTGVRPALIIQNDLGNQYSSTTIVAAVTSRQKKKYPFHVEFTAEESGLVQDGTVLLEQLLIIDQGRLRQRRGQLPPARMGEVNEALKRSLALP